MVVTVFVVAFELTSDPFSGGAVALVHGEEELALF
jgi:hypothetical protein